MFEPRSSPQVTTISKHNENFHNFQNMMESSSGCISVAKAAQRLSDHADRSSVDSVCALPGGGFMVLNTTLAGKHSAPQMFDHHGVQVPIEPDSVLHEASAIAVFDDGTMVVASQEKVHIVFEGAIRRTLEVNADDTCWGVSFAIDNKNRRVGIRTLFERLSICNVDTGVKESTFNCRRFAFLVNDHMAIISSIVEDRVSIFDDDSNLITSLKQPSKADCLVASENKLVVGGGEILPWLHFCVPRP